MLESDATVSPHLRLLDFSSLFFGRMCVEAYILQNNVSNLFWAMYALRLF